MSPRSSASLAAIASGALWIPYGVFELLDPFGTATTYDAARGFDIVDDRALHLLYSLPGALAIALGAWALRGLPESRSRGARVTTALVLAMAAVCVGVGVGAAFDPFFTGPRVLGTLLLGCATLLAARSAAGSRRRLLVALGATGVGLLAIWPLVYATGLLTPAAGAALIAAYGLGWIALGVHDAAPGRLT